MLNCNAASNNSNKTWQIRDVLSGPKTAEENNQKVEGQAPEGNDLGFQESTFSQKDNRSG